MTIRGALVALLLSTPAAADVTIPSPPFIGGVLSLPGGISASSTGPVWQMVNTGTGNAAEIYVATGGSGLLVSSPGRTVWSGGNVFGAFAFTGPLISVRSRTGFVDIFADSLEGVTDFQGGGIQMGGTLGTTSQYGNKGMGRVVWNDSFGGGLVFQTSMQGNRFSFGSGAHQPQESFFQVGNGSAVWAFAARSSSVTTPTISYSWGCSSNNRPFHSVWGTANGTTIMYLSSGASTGNLSVPAGDVSASGSFLPLTDNTGSVGSGSLRFATIRAVTVTTGDFGFEDECCPVCGKCFNVGEDVVLRIRRQDREESGRTLSRAVPIHAECRK